MDYESMLMGVINNNLSKKVVAAQQSTQREDRSMPDSTRRAFESRMRSDAAVARMASQNMDDAKAMVNVAQTNVTAIKSQFQEIQKLLTECAESDTLAASQELMDRVKASIVDHVTEIQRLAQNAEFNCMHLFDGTAGKNQDGTVELQAGASVREQSFMNLLDSSLSGVCGTNSMNLGALLSSDGDLSGTELDFSSQRTAKDALDKVETYIARMQGLESQYSYDYKSLDNLHLLFEEQADIYEQTAERHSAGSGASTSNSTILSELLSSNAIVSGSA